jgi:hypothetical protein
MSISLTNLRRRLVTILAPEGSGKRAVRIASMQTATGLDDAVLDLPAVQTALRAGELEARREVSKTSSLPAPESPSPSPSRSRKARSDG